MAGPMDVARHNRFNGYILGDGGGVSVAATGRGVGSLTGTSGVQRPSVHNCPTLISVPSQ
jgi:hypothetical protein